jgi:ribose 5-phosphate isomerase A
MLINEKGKRAAAFAAADLIQSGMIVGLGTGSTASYFIEALSERAKNGCILEGVVPSSTKSLDLAIRAGLKVQDLNSVSRVDITVDGADEIDPLKRMIKGGGGAHMREKILASVSKELIIIVDESKLVPAVGRAKLPVEVLPFGFAMIETKLASFGCQGIWRKDKNLSSFFITENGNYLYDITFSSPPSSPEQIDKQILEIPGVLDTGFFFNLAGRVIVGFLDGNIIIR